MDNANLWTRRTNSSKLSLSTSGADAKDSARVELPRPSKRFGPDSSHGRSNPFNAISPLSGGVSSPSTNASSAFGLGSGAFASFGAPKTPGGSELKTPGREVPLEHDEATRKAFENQSVAAPGEHPLKSTWISTVPLASISSVESFWAVYSHLKRPSLLPTVSDYHIFKKGIRPVWEDEANKRGGKWIVRFKKGVSDRYWEDLLLAMVGDQFAEAGDEVCGAVLSVRGGEDVLSVWTRIDGGAQHQDQRLLSFPADTNIIWKSHDDSIAQRSAIDQARHDKTATGTGHQERRRTGQDDSDKAKPAVAL
ncbi:uncharacterized protein N7487_000228 [Penicillium crustosum]|uniref:uncharacterized protein n=1 Tax=Penicillium crustosum TaxID=36656 RepID=UPI0023877764|nr:uncharacterized protein N7487_000228 [Penicillium crustosum]KAJ5416678.1 hypothetical protein N7487_000228 [Penicillium crustosum]